MAPTKSTSTPNKRPRDGRAEDGGESRADAADDKFFSVAVAEPEEPAKPDESAAPIWAAGPSLPADPPNAMVMTVATSFTGTTDNLIFPECR